MKNATPARANGVNAAAAAEETTALIAQAKANPEVKLAKTARTL
jgi:hypothetical protein